MSFDLETIFAQARRTSEEMWSLILESRIIRQQLRVVREESERYRENDQLIERNHRQRVKAFSGGSLDASPDGRLLSPSMPVF